MTAPCPTDCDWQPHILDGTHHDETCEALISGYLAGHECLPGDLDCTCGVTA